MISLFPSRAVALELFGFSIHWYGIMYLLDPVSERYLAGTTIDYVAGLNGTGFAFRNPNAQGSCGCGQSFNA